MLVLKIVERVVKSGSAETPGGVKVKWVALELDLGLADGDTSEDSDENTDESEYEEQSEVVGDFEALSITSTIAGRIKPREKSVTTTPAKSKLTVIPNSSKPITPPSLAHLCLLDTILRLAALESSTSMSHLEAPDALLSQYLQSTAAGVGLTKVVQKPKLMERFLNG